MAQSAGLSATVAILFGDLGRIASAGADLLSLKFSRDHERDADSTGLSLLVKAGLQPAAMASFFRKMAAQGGGVPALTSAANEIAVEAFLNRKIGFLDIVEVVEQVMLAMGQPEADSIETVIAIDAEARSRAAEFCRSRAAVAV